MTDLSREARRQYYIDVKTKTESRGVGPAGIDRLGHATKNICEQGALYADATHYMVGQTLPSKTYWDSHEAPRPDEVAVGPERKTKRRSKAKRERIIAARLERRKARRYPTTEKGVA